MLEDEVPKDQIPFSRALIWVFMSVLVVTGTAMLGWLYLLHHNHQRAGDPNYNIVSVIQTTSSKESLDTSYLAELMGLSSDHPTNLYNFKVIQAERKLQASPLIAEVKVEKISPQTVFVEYTPREPAAFLGDASNTAIDSSDVLIPFKPFYSPKRLPIIYLGTYNLPLWGKPLEGERATLALEVWRHFNDNYSDHTTELQSLDVSRAFSESYGQREIVIQIQSVIEKGDTLVIAPRVLRLSSDNYTKALADYQKLCHYLNQNINPAEGGELTQELDPQVIDLRIDKLAFMEE